MEWRRSINGYGNLKTITRAQTVLKKWPGSSSNAFVPEAAPLNLSGYVILL
jgi:hypothetical protein